MLAQVLRWGPDAEGSTRAAGLLRIALALIVWARFATPVRGMMNEDLTQTAFALFFFAGTALMLAGLFTRLGVAMTALSLMVLYFYMGHVRAYPGWNGHHVYILMAAVTLLTLAPAGRSFSADRWLALRRAARAGLPPPAEAGPLWAQRLIVLQMSALYFWTAVDKTGAHFLSGERLEAILIWGHEGRALGPILLAPGLAMLAAVTVTAVEYALSVAILFRRALWLAVPAALAMHAVFFLLLPVSTYSVTMMALYLAVVPPDGLSRFLERMMGRSV